MTTLRQHEANRLELAAEYYRREEITLHDVHALVLELLAGEAQRAEWDADFDAQQAREDKTNA